MSSQYLEFLIPIPLVHTCPLSVDNPLRLSVRSQILRILSMNLSYRFSTSLGSIAIDISYLLERIKYSNTSSHKIAFYTFSIDIQAE